MAPKAKMRWLKRLTIHSAWIVPLATALTALVTQYVQHTHLEEQNARMLKVLGRQLNNLGSQVAYMQGVLKIPPQPLVEPEVTSEKRVPEKDEPALLKASAFILEHVPTTLLELDKLDASP